jgi:PAS domain S-box-containing protein
MLSMNRRDISNVNPDAGSDEPGEPDAESGNTSIGLRDQIRILFIEDNPDDLELLTHELKRNGIRYTACTVQTKIDYERELISFNPQVILSDYSLPSFNGLSAFQIKQNVLPDVPFIIVSGTIGDENAVALIRNGITDYVLKENMYQVPLKISRALKETAERKEKAMAETLLSRSREQLQKILDQSLDLICTFDEAGTFLSASAASKSVLGYTPQELIGKSVWSIIHPDDLHRSIDTSGKVVNGLDATNFENRFRTSEGKYVWLHWSAKWDAREKVSYCVARDVTEKKQAEALLQNREKRFKALLENSTDGLSIFSEDGFLLEVSLSGQKILNYDPDTLVGKSFLDIVHQEDRVKVNDAFRYIIDQPQQVKYIEYRSLLPDGSYRWIELNFQNQLQEPAVGAIIAHYRDITERKLSQLLIHESEEKYRTLFDMSPFPMWVFDVETFRFLKVNNAAIRHYGYSREEFLSMSIKDIRPQNDIGKVERIVSRTKVTGAFSRGVFTHIRKNGQRICVDIQSNLIELDGRKARLVLAKDITVQMRYVKDIEDKNKRLNEIAWVQSHVVRAPLARIKGLIEFIKFMPAEELNLQEVLNNIMASADELDNVIHEIVQKTEQLEN